MSNRFCKLSSHLGKGRSVKMKNVKEGNYIGQNYVGSIREAVRVLIERLRSVFQPSNALIEVLMGNEFQFTRYQNIVLLVSP
jgi:hypothetical protein